MDKEILKEKIEDLTKDVELTEDVKDKLKEYDVDKEILEIEDWDYENEVRYPLTHVATLSGKKVYAREMSLRDYSNFIEKMKNLKNDVEFAAYAVCELAYTETGDKFFKSQIQKQKVMDKKPIEIFKLYLKLFKVSEPEQYKKNLKDKE